MKVLLAAYHKLANYPSFSLLMGRLLEGDEDTEAVALFLEVQRKKGFLGADVVGLPALGAHSSFSMA